MMRAEILLFVGLALCIALLLLAPLFDLAATAKEVLIELRRMNAANDRNGDRQ